MNICFCNTNRAWGGGEKWHLETALAVAAQGWRSFVICHPKGELYKKVCNEPSLTAIPLALNRLSFLCPAIHVRLVALFRKENIQSVIMNLPIDVKCIAPAAKRAGVRHIIYRRGSALPVRNSWLNRWLLGSVITRLLVNSEETRRMVLQQNQNIIPENRITLLPNGIDTAHFDALFSAAQPLTLPISRTTSAKTTSSDNTPLAAAALDIIAQNTPSPHNRPIVLGNAGRLTTQKGQHFLLHLGATLAAKNCDFHLVIAGSGEREKELRALAQQLDITHRVTFTGFMDNLAPFWHSIDVFVLTSLWEGFGYVLLEAMLAMRPVIAWQTSNIPELITHGKNGLLIPLPQPTENIDMADMATAVIALAEDTALRQRMGEEGRAFALSNFAQAPLLEKLQALMP